MESLKRFPSFLFLIGWILFLGYKYYSFAFSSDGQLQVEQRKYSDLKEEVSKLTAKTKEGAAFLKSVEAKKDSIRGQQKRLTDYQGALPEISDVPNMMKMLLTEARKIEIRVDRIEPARKNQKEYYLEQEFKLDLRGSYQQVILFLYRISQMQRILRIGGFDMKPSTQSLSSRYTTLAVSLSISAFQYTQSKEDRLTKDDSVTGGAKP